MATRYRKKQFSAAYIRFHNQLMALHEGKIRQVKQIARDARQELDLKYKRQLTLRLER
ncbi:hypothetical protein HY407_04795 [Candidatus Gottesmanbacteria bacterium]|nr:hypothetical protein [Candidatus Gottesmanbacteria bacterium]